MGLLEAGYIVEQKTKYQLTSGSNRAFKTGYLRASIGGGSYSGGSGHGSGSFPEHTGLKLESMYRVTVTPAAKYAIYIHEGTRYMRARPFLAAGLKDAVPEIEKIFGRRVKTLIQTI